MIVSGSYINETNSAYPQQSSSCISSSCFGLLASVAVSCSENTLDLVSITGEVVALAFRIGLLVQARTNSVSGSANENRPCSCVVSGVDDAFMGRILDTYCNLRGLSAMSRIYVSALGTGSVTISGPPNTLKEFLSQHSELKAAQLQVKGLFHSSCLYKPEEVEEVIDRLSSRLTTRASHLKIISNSGGAESQLPKGATCIELMKLAVSEILLHQLRWDLIVKRTGQTAQDAQFSTVHVLPFGSGNVESIASALRNSPGVTLTQVLDTSPTSLHRAKGATRSKIAIIGYSGRFPEADDNQEFWDLLAAGLDVHKEIPKDRFDPWMYYDPTGKKKNTSGVTKGCFVKNADLFDSKFFNMSPREADQSDPAQRLALMTAYEAMEMAGFVPDSTPSTQRSRVGVFYGTASDDYREVNSAQNVDTYFVPGGSRAFLPGRINYFFRFAGPSFDVDTACSSGLAAVHIACNALWTQDCDVAIAGGTNILTSPDNWAGLDRGHFLSRTGNCNTFDDAADGYCRSDSVATVLLKRLDDALLDGDPIFGTILGAYTNHSAEAVSITRPHSGAQRAIFGRILDSANVEGSEVSYVEMHGTGTQHGDACEMDSVLSTFAPGGARRPKSLHLGSAKANIGHAESASGVASLIKVLLMMKNNAIPPHVGIKTKINRNFPTDLDQRNVHIAMKVKPWMRPDASLEPFGRRAFVNNFGAAGGNSSVLIEDGPLRPLLGVNDPAWAQHVIAVSAKTPGSFKKNVQSLLRYLDEFPDVSLDSLSYTTTARRTHYNFRTAVVGATVGDIKKSLGVIAEKEKHLSIAGSSTAVGFCFTGQGSQYLGMGKKLFSLPSFQTLLMGLDDIVRMQGFESFLDLITGESKIPLDQTSPVKVQLSITCLQMALGKLLIALGITPQVLVGHSLGEYAALNVAGVLSDADTIHLVGSRARLLEQHCAIGSHAMLAIRASEAKVMSIRAASYQDLDIACINGPEETVVAGSNEQIESFKGILNTHSVKSTHLKVQFAFHSAQVEPLLDDFRHVCASIKLRDPIFPVLSPLLGKPIRAASDMGSASDYFARHCRETVQFHACLTSAKQLNVMSDRTTWVEVGPHPVCSNMLKSCLDSSIKTLPCLRRGEDDWGILLPTLTSLYENGVAVNWSEYHSGSVQKKHVIQLPAYQWDLKSHWIQYEHDWCLTKGSAPVAAPASLLQAKAIEKTFFTTSVQEIMQEEYSAVESSITAHTDVQHPDFRDVLLAHKVNTRALCSSAVYADMALTLFTRLLEKSSVTFDKTDIGVEIANMAVDKSLILSDKGPQLLQLKAHVNWSTRQATFALSSISPKDGRPTDHHAKCVGYFTEKSRWKAEWKRRDFLVKSRIADLRKSAHDDDGGAHMIKTGMFYKLFSALVDYEPSFKGCREAIMRSADMESTAKVKFNTPPGTSDKWLFPPQWIDSLGQITGFTMNANDEVDSHSQVYINHGWDNMKVSEPLSDSKTYVTYIKMQPKDKNSYCGDVYVFEQDLQEVVAIYEGVTFVCLQKKVLDLVLPREKTAPAKAQAAQPKTAAVPTVTPAAPSELQVEPPALILPGQGEVPSEKLKKIIAEEVGASIDDVHNDAELAELGVDSLLALTMADRMFEEMSLKVDSATFINCLTVGELVSLILGSSAPSSDSGSSTPPITPDQDEPQPTYPLAEVVQEKLATVTIDVTELDSFDSFHSPDVQPIFGKSTSRTALQPFQILLTVLRRSEPNGISKQAFRRSAASVFGSPARKYCHVFADNLAVPRWVWFRNLLSAHPRH